MSSVAAVIRNSRFWLTFKRYDNDEAEPSKEVFFRQETKLKANWIDTSRKASGLVAGRTYKDQHRTALANLEVSAHRFEA